MFSMLISRIRSGGTYTPVAIENDVTVDETTGILTLPSARLIASRLSTGADCTDFVGGRATLDHVIATLSNRPLERIEPAAEWVRTLPDELRGIERKLEALREPVERVTQASRTVDELHQERGRLMWERCGMERSAAGLETALRELPELRERFWTDVRVPGSAATLNQSLEKAGRVADFFELGELMCRDALTREESCGGHFREEYQTPEGEAMRDDDNFAYVAAWEFKGEGQFELHKEELQYENIKIAARSYK